MNVARQLYQLQEIDLEIADDERRLEQVNGRLGDDEVVVAVQQKLSIEKEKRGELQHQQRSLEGEIDDVAAKIKKGEDELYGGRINNPKELSNLQHEVELLKAKRDQLETKDLELMERVESVEDGMAALQGELKEGTSAWQREQEQLKKEKAALESSLDDLNQKRQALTAEIEPKAVTLYEQLRKNKGFAVARVEQGICRGCRISLSSSELQQARGGALVQCGSCNRILYLP
jgi:predicted  nucleic acid-binding Zn-ribbon protein